MILLWVALAFAAGCIFGAVMMSLFVAGNRAEQDFEGGGIPQNEHNTTV